MTAEQITEIREKLEALRVQFEEIEGKGDWDTHICMSQMLVYIHEMNFELEIYEKSDGFLDSKEFRGF